MRSFIAIELTEKARREIVAKTAEFRSKGSKRAGVTWVKPENLHVTLVFLGDIEEKQISLVVVLLLEILSTVKPFELRIGRPADLGGRVLVVEIDDPQQALVTIVKRIRESCKSIGITTETRKFRPHVTIARIRGHKSADRLIKENNRTVFDPVSFTVKEAVLFKSCFGSNGVSYLPLARIPLS